MKSCWALLIFLFLNLEARAEEFKAYVQSFDPEIDLREVESDKVESYRAPKTSGHVAELPPPREMDRIFKEAGFGQEVLGMEQMDKDLFYLKVQKKPLEYLQRKYPDISIKKIKKLKSMIEVNQ